MKKSKIFLSLLALVLLLSLNFSLPVSAEILVLKSGQKIEGQIIEKTDAYIKIEFQGIVLTYWSDEIDRVVTKKPTTKKYFPPVQYIPHSQYKVPGVVSSGVTKTDSVPSGKIFLWQVNSGKAGMYLLGSIHLANSSLYPLDKRIESAFDKSDVLVVEADISDMNSFMNLSFIEKGLYPPGGGETLEKNLSRATLKRVKDEVASLGLDFNQMNMYQPWFLAMQLVGLKLAQLGFDPMYGIDMYFLQKASGRKTISELESIDYQMSLFSNLSAKEQELFLLSNLLDLDILAAKMDKLFSAWKSGNAASIEATLRKGLKEHPEIAPIYEKILFKRNKNMVIKLKKLLQTNNTYFVIVGAAHLVGNEGIVQLLRNSGYSVKQL